MVKLTGFDHINLVFDGNDASHPLERSALDRKFFLSRISDVVVAMTEERMKMINGQLIVVNGGVGEEP
ncbi:MAG: hypothetical protein J6N21_11360 [Butyrivibrio sp.]|nr:hypothetical protein [Butyrivibrio sp.]